MLPKWHLLSSHLYRVVYVYKREPSVFFDLLLYFLLRNAC